MTILLLATSLAVLIVALASFMLDRCWECGLIDIKHWCQAVHNNYFYSLPVWLLFKSRIYIREITYLQCNLQKASKSYVLFILWQFFWFLWYKGGLAFIIWMFDSVILRESMLLKKLKFCWQLLLKGTSQNRRGNIWYIRVVLSVFYLRGNWNFSGSWLQFFLC